MPRKPKHGLTDQEVVDALVTKNAEAQAETEPEILPPPEPPQEPTIADRFVGMNDLIVRQRQTTRLSEATLAKTLELAFQYHAWQTQWDAQQAQRQGFDPSILMGNGEDGEELVGPTGEYLGEAEPTPLFPTEETTTEEEDTDGS